MLNGDYPDAGNVHCSHIFPHVGEAFRTYVDAGQSLDIQLIEATDLSARYPSQQTEGRGRPFSIVFRGPGDILLPQAIYQIAHDQIGTFDLFIVPIGGDKDGLRYEAVFN